MINRANVQKNYKWKNTGNKTDKAAALSVPKQISISEPFWFNLLALLFGMASINGLYPFGLSYTATSVLYRKKFVSAGIFSLIGVILAVKSFAFTRHLAAIIVFTLAFLFFEEVLKSKSYLAGVLVFVSNSVAGMAFLMLRGITPYDVVLLTMESLAASIMTFIIPVGLPWVFRGSGHLGRAEKCVCMSILTGVILSIAASLQIFEINARDVLAIIAVLLMAGSAGPGAGAISGIIIGIMGYPFPFSSWSVSIMAFAGLISGTFKNLGRVGSVIGFTLGYVIYNFYINSMGESLITITTLLISFGLFLIIPGNLFNKLAYNLKEIQDFDMSDSIVMPKFAEERLYEIASIISDLGSFFNDPVDSMDRTDAGKHFEDVCMEIQDKVCYGCGMYRICWEREPGRTVKAFYVLIRGFEKNSLRALPHIFKSRCGRLEDIKHMVAGKSQLYNMQKRLDRIIDHNRNLICRYFEKASEVIKDIAAGINEEVDTTLDDKLSESLSQLGVRPERIFAVGDAKKCEISIVKPPCIGEKQCETVIPRGISEVIGKRFYTKIIDCPLKTGCLKCRLKAVTYGTLGISVGASGAAKAGQQVSGDKFVFVDLNNGKYMAALSDGMGVGEKASRHSERTLKVTERLLKAGFGLEFALKMVNYSMILSTQDESFSTLDLILIDTYGGRAEFIKAGAPASYIKRGKKVTIIEGKNPPIGILGDISHTIMEENLKSGDTVIMVTDGVLEAINSNVEGNDLMCKIISDLRTSTPQDMSNEILSMAKSRGSCNDDITALVIHITDRNG